ncbi:hypothetical protein [Klebsiella pneumoniae]|uniref:hypothetical protein n=1 Tax=Klebsiella pneumoniae TaxID=573 RepID=UPI000E3482B6|nr:hypothetical protein [Klebsiella pneumoniae]
MGSCAAPSAKGDDKFITTDYLQQCRIINIRDAADTNVQTGQNNLQSAKSVAQLTSALSELAKQFWEKRG